MPLEIPNQDGFNRGHDPFPRPWERTAVQPMDAEALTLAMGLGKNTLIGGVLIGLAHAVKDAAPAPEPNPDPRKWRGYDPKI